MPIDILHVEVCELRASQLLLNFLPLLQVEFTLIFFLVFALLRESCKRDIVFPLHVLQHGVVLAFECVQKSGVVVLHIVEQVEERAVGDVVVLQVMAKLHDVLLEMNEVILLLGVDIILRLLLDDVAVGLVFLSLLGHGCCVVDFVHIRVCRGGSAFGLLLLLFEPEILGEVQVVALGVVDIAQVIVRIAGLRVVCIPRVHAQVFQCVSLTLVVNIL